MRFPALSHRAFTMFWASNIVSRMGTQMRDVALAWHLYTLTHSALALGMIGAARVVPVMALALVGGVAADAYDRRRIMIVTQALLAVTSTALAITTHLGLLHLGLLYAAVAVSGATVAFDAPARQTLVTNLLPVKDLENGLTLGVFGFQVAGAIGPVLGGLLLARTNPETVYAVDAASYLVVIAALVNAKTSVSTTRKVAKATFGALGEAFAYLKQKPVLIWLMLVDFLATFFGGALQLLPIFASEVFGRGPEAFGILAAATPAGALLASAVMSTRAPVERYGVVVTASIVVYGAAIALFGLTPWFYAGVALLALSGAADTVSTVVRQVVRQMATPDELRGRMTGVNMMFFIGGPQLGDVEAGVLATLTSARVSVAAGGLACALVGFAFMSFVPSLRSLRVGSEAMKV